MSHETINTREGLSLLKFKGAFDCLRHGFSLRHGGVSRPPYDTLNTGFHVGDEPAAVVENRRRLALALGYQDVDVIAGQQVHGSGVAVVDGTMRGRGACSDKTALPATDGLVCCEPGVVLMCHAADCTILFFYDAVQRIIGLAHAGWRGAVAGIGLSMIDAMKESGSKPENIHAALAPTIGPCCYRVGEDLAEQVPVRWRDRVLFGKLNQIYFDLPKLQHLLLSEAGIRDDKILKSNFCTCCSGDKFFSHRASGGHTGRMAAIISL
jgi:polyphenol oxidase